MHKLNIGRYRCMYVIPYVVCVCMYVCMYCVCVVCLCVHVLKKSLILSGRFLSLSLSLSSELC